MNHNDLRELAHLAGLVIPKIHNLRTIPRFTTFASSEKMRDRDGFGILIDSDPCPRVNCVSYRKELQRNAVTVRFINAFRSRLKRSCRTVVDGRKGTQARRTAFKDLAADQH